MSNAEFFDVSVSGAETTVSLSSDTLTRVDSAGQMSRRLCDLLQDQPPLDSGKEDPSLVNLDFSNVDRITSAGLNGLIQLRSRSRVLGFRVKLVNVPTKVREVFELTRLERMFEFEESAITLG